MKTTTAISVLSLGTVALFVGQLSTSLAPAAHARPDDGGVAGGGTTCSTAPAAALGANAFSTAGATADLAVGAGGSCDAHTIYNVNYFSFTPSETGSYSFSTCGSAGWDTRIAVIPACGSNQTPVACNDDACNYQSTATGNLTAGTNYKIVVGGYGNTDSGSGSIEISFGSGGGGGGGNGPDVIVGDLPNISKYGSVTSGGQTIMAYAIGTTSCNIGDELLSWFASPSNLHPFIPQNIYRIKSGRIEHIGLGWGKHGFTALQGTVCGSCQASSSGNWLGIGCSDPYSSSLNGSQSGLGARSEVNPATGIFPGNYNAGMPSAPATIGRRVQVNANDLNPTMNVGATYLVEAQYIHPGDAAAGNDDNNASWRSCTIGSLTSGAYSIALTGTTHRQEAAIEAWKAAVPSVTITPVDVAGDGRFLVAYNATDNGNGTWRYNYAIQNINSDQGGRSFSIPLPAGVIVTNAGFHDINYHSGDPYSGTDWTISTSGGSVTWTGGTYATSPNGNALRFSTIYTFWFDANAAPTKANGTLGLFKPGTVGEIVVVGIGPEGEAANPADINGDGVVDGQDLATMLSQWGLAGSSADIDGDGSVGGGDLAALLAAWG
ncbi:MAG: hypothetical protein O2819_06800 [Planctomycetota bacterium]|nr:hypothetical protein [Planctomycetota bacterium]